MSRLWIPLVALSLVRCGDVEDLPWPPLGSGDAASLDSSGADAVSEPDLGASEAATDTSSSETSPTDVVVDAPREDESIESERERDRPDSERRPSLCDPRCEAGQFCMDGTCEPGPVEDILRGCHPLHQGLCAYPWPSDYFTVAADTSTGLRPVYDPALLPANDLGTSLHIEHLLEGVEGFSPNVQIRFVPGAEVDSSALPPQTDIGASLLPESPIWLVQLDSGERWPFFAELDARNSDPATRAVFVRPMKRLDFGARYAVAVRALPVLSEKGGQFTLLEPSPMFRALRDDVPTELPPLEAYRPAMQSLFAELEALGLPREELTLAFTFTTNSRSALQSDLRQMVAQARDLIVSGNLGYTIDQVEDNEGAVARIVRGRYNVPSCMTGDAGPGQRLRRSPDGQVQCEGLAEAPFVLAVPRDVWDGGQPAPAVVYGHGLLGGAEETRYVAARTPNVILAGTDGWGMSGNDVGHIAGLLSQNFANARSVPERLLQACVNHATLGALLIGELAQDPVLMVEGTSLVNGERVDYAGGSQGGILGGTIMAMAPNFQRGLLVVGGANYSLMVWRSTSFATVNGFWALTHANEIEREFLFSLFQSAFDQSDPMIYEDALAEDLMSPGPAKELLLIAAIGDTQVPNIASDVMARTYGMSMLPEPVYSVWGLPELAQPANGRAYLQVDTQTAFMPPSENLPAHKDNGAHGAVADGPGVRNTMEQFLVEGILQSACEGPCDPD